MEDRREIWRVAKVLPLQALTVGFETTPQTLTLEHAGEPIACFGICPMTGEGLEGVGRPWLLGTPEIAEVSRGFIRLSRKWLGRLSKGFSSLSNIMDAQNEVHIRWVQWLGFEIVGDLQIGFHRFYHFRKDL